MGLNIGVNVNADVSKLQALDRQMKQLTRSYEELAKKAKMAGTSFGQSIPGQMPLAGSVTPPSGLALMSSTNPHAGLAGSKMPPVMWGPGFRAQMHQMMPGQMAHQSGAQAALSQLQQKGQPLSTVSSTYSTGGITRQDAQKMTQSLDNLAKILQSAATAPRVSNTAPAGNPFISLAASSDVLRAQSAFSGVSLPQGTVNRMAVSQALLASNTGPQNASSGMAGRKPSVLGRVVQAGSRMLRMPYYGEMAGGAAADALGIGGSLAGIGMTAGIGALIGAGMWGAHKIGQGYQTYLQTANPLSNLYHSTMPGSSFGSFYNSIIAQGNSVGASNVMKAQVAQILASTGGSSALGSVGSVFQGAVGLGYGVNGATTLASQIAEVQRLGLTSGSSASTSNKGLMMMLGNATITGGMQGRTNELLNALTSLTQTLDQQRSTPPNVASLLGMMTTLNQSGLQAFQGQRGANKLATVNSALTNPGNGAAGQVWMYNALTNGTNLGPFGESYLAQQGITGQLNGAGPTNLQRIIQYSLSQFPSLKSGLSKTGMPTSHTQRVALGWLSGELGLSMPQTQTFMYQFMKNGQFSMASLGNEQKWWQNKFNGSPNASWVTAGAQLYNAKSYKDIMGVASALQTGGVGLTTTEQQQLAQLQKMNPRSSQFKSTMSALKKEMGGQMMNSPMLTATDQLTKAINNNTNTWSTIGQSLLPFAKALNNVEAFLGGSTFNKLPPHKTVSPSQARNGVPGNINASYNYTGHTPASQFMMNMAYATALGGGSLFGLSSSSVVQDMTYKPSGGYGPAPTGGSAGVSQWSTYIKQAAARYGVPANMIAAVMQEESGGKNGLTSSAGAMGLMQLMPQTAKGLGVSNPWNPQQNILAGTKLLSQLYQQFHGNWSSALGAYNGGPGNAQGGQEQAYAAAVEGFYAAFQKHSPIQVNVNVNGGTYSSVAQWQQQGGA